MTREEIVERMARAAKESELGRGVPIHAEEREPMWHALAAIYGAIPGLSDVLEGKAVIHPTKPTEEMIRAGVAYRLTTNIGGKSWPDDTAGIWNTMSAVNPYRSKSDA